AAILDDPHPGLASLEGAAQVLEYGGGDIRMTDQIVRRADQILAFEAADRGKDIVAIGDSTFKVRGGNQSFLVREGKFALSDRQVLSHAGTPGNEHDNIIVWACAGV